MAFWTKHNGLSINFFLNHLDKNWKRLKILSPSFGRYTEKNVWNAELNALEQKVTVRAGQ